MTIRNILSNLSRIRQNVLILKKEQWMSIFLRTLVLSVVVHLALFISIGFVPTLISGALRFVVYLCIVTYYVGKPFFVPFDPLPAPSPEATYIRQLYSRSLGHPAAPYFSKITYLSLGISPFLPKDIAMGTYLVGGLSLVFWISLVPAYWRATAQLYENIFIHPQTLKMKGFHFWKIGSEFVVQHGTKIVPVTAAVISVDVGLTKSCFGDDARSYTDNIVSNWFMGFKSDSHSTVSAYTDLKKRGYVPGEMLDDQGVISKSKIESLKKK